MSKECNKVNINAFLVLYIVSCFSLFKPWGRIDILRSYCASTRHAASSFSIFLRNISRKIFMKFKWQESPLDITINILSIPTWLLWENKNCRTLLHLYHSCSRIYFYKNKRTLKLFQTGCPKTTSGGCGNKILIHKLLLKDRNDSIKRKITESS